MVSVFYFAPLLLLTTVALAAPDRSDFEIGSEEGSFEESKRASPGFADVESVCNYFHRKCLLGENSNEKCVEPLRECLSYGKLLLKGSYKLCMYMLEDSSECGFRQLAVINKLARDIHRGKIPLKRTPARRSDAPF